MFANLVFHRPDGFVECCDDEVAGTGADYFADVGGVVVDGERDGSSYVGGNGEGCSLRIEAEREDELSAPGWAELVEDGVGTEDLGLIGCG